MEQDFIEKTAQQMVEAGQYASIDQARATLLEGLKKSRQQEKQQRQQAVKNMNRKQRRKTNRDADKMLKRLMQQRAKPSEQFAALPQEQQKEVLLKILEKVHQQNVEYEEQKKDVNAEN